METPFWLGTIQVTPDANRIARDGEDVRLPPRLMKLLCLLAGAGGDTVRREGLVEALWPRGYVNEEALSRAVAELRSMLGDDARQPRYIETVPKRGYRLLVPASETAPVEEVEVMAGHEKQKRPHAFTWIAAALTLAFGFYMLMPEPPGRPQSSQLNAALLASATRITSEQTLKYQPELSSDGQWLAYVRRQPGYSELVVVPTAQPTDQRVIALETRAWSPVFSPDPGTLALVTFADGACQITQLSLASGEATPLGSCLYPGDAPILDWSADGRWLAFVDEDPKTGSAAVWRLSLADGQRQQLTFPPDAYSFDTRPRFSPDGSQLAFTRGTPAAREIWVQTIGTGQPRQLSFDHQYIKSFDWLPDGTSLVLDSERSGYRALWQLSLGGDWTLLGARDAQSPSMAGNKLAFRIAQFEANIWRIELPDVAEVTEPIIASTKYDSNPAFSPDGREIAFSSNRTGTGAIWLAGADGSRQRILFEPSQGRVVWPNWSPDGQQIIATRYSNRGQDLVTIALDKREVNVLATGGQRPYGGAWSADGEWIIYVAGSGAQGTRLWRQKADGSDSPAIWLDLPVNRFAADGESLYFSLHGQAGLYQLPIDAVGKAQPVAVLPDLQIRFWDDWFLFDGWIYLPELRSGQPPRLIRMRPGGGPIEEVAGNIATALGPNVAIHPSGAFLLMARTDRIESDIFLSSLDGE